MDSDDGSVRSAESDALPPTKVEPVATLKGSNLNTANGVGMPKFGLRGDDAGMFDLASDDSDDGACDLQPNLRQIVVPLTLRGLISLTCVRVGPVVVRIFWEAVYRPPSRWRRRGGGSGSTVWW